MEIIKGESLNVSPNRDSASTEDDSSSSFSTQPAFTLEMKTNAIQALQNVVETEEVKETVKKSPRIRPRTIFNITAMFSVLLSTIWFEITRSMMPAFMDVGNGVFLLLTFLVGLYRAIVHYKDPLNIQGLKKVENIVGIIGYLTIFYEVLQLLTGLNVQCRSHRVTNHDEQVTHMTVETVNEFLFSIKMLRLFFIYRMVHIVTVEEKIPMIVKIPDNIDIESTAESGVLEGGLNDETDKAGVPKGFDEGSDATEKDEKDWMDDRAGHVLQDEIITSLARGQLLIFLVFGLTLHLFYIQHVSKHDTLYFITSMLQDHIDEHGQNMTEDYQELSEKVIHKFKNTLLRIEFGTDTLYEDDVSSKIIRVNEQLLYRSEDVKILQDIRDEVRRYHTVNLIMYLLLMVILFLVTQTSVTYLLRKKISQPISDCIHILSRLFDNLVIFGNDHTEQRRILDHSSEMDLIFSSICFLCQLFEPLLEEPTEIMKSYKYHSQSHIHNITLQTGSNGFHRGSGDMGIGGWTVDSSDPSKNKTNLINRRGSAELTNVKSPIATGKSVIESKDFVIEFKFKKIPRINLTEKDIKEQIVKIPLFNDLSKLRKLSTLANFKRYPELANVESCIGHPLCRHYFKLYCESNFSGEYFAFMEEVTKFKKEVKSLFDEIFYKYIRNRNSGLDPNRTSVFDTQCHHFMNSRNSALFKDPPSMSGNSGMSNSSKAALLLESRLISIGPKQLKNLDQLRNDGNVSVNSFDAVLIDVMNTLRSELFVSFQSSDYAKAYQTQRSNNFRTFSHISF